MTTDITQYRLTHKRMTGQTLKLFFEKRSDQQIKKVLELKNIAAFIDSISDLELISFEISAGGGSYGLDMSMQLKRPEVQNFKEVFVFTDAAATRSVFRSLSEHATWRDFDNEPLGDINY